MEDSGDALDVADGRKVDRRRRIDWADSFVFEKDAGPEDSEEGGEGDGDTDFTEGGTRLCARNVWPSSTAVPTVLLEDVDGNVSTSSSDTPDVCVDVGLIMSCVLASTMASCSSALSEVECRGALSDVWLSVEELGSSKVKCLGEDLASAVDLVGVLGAFVTVDSEERRSPRSRSTPKRTVLRREPLRRRPCGSGGSSIGRGC